MELALTLLVHSDRVSNDKVPDSRPVSAELRLRKVPINDPETCNLYLAHDGWLMGDGNRYMTLKANQRLVDLDNPAPLSNRTPATCIPRHRGGKTLKYRRS